MLTTTAALAWHSKERNMSHIIAFIAGIIVATVGFTGIAEIADKGVTKVQDVAKDVAK